MTNSTKQTDNRLGEGSYWPVDLHAHTVASDGTLSPVELVDLAAAREMQVIAITDHDTVDGLAAAISRAREQEITLVTGVELSTTERGAEVHVLGYGLDPDDASLREDLAQLAASRYRRIATMIERLQDAGFPLDGDAILAQADEGSIGRPHVARALIDLGVVSSVDEAFDRFLRPGRPGWVPREPFTPEQAVRLLDRHGAVPVLAHPYSTGNVEGVLDRLTPVGLRGMEVWYGEYDDAQRESLRGIAASRGLIPTGGSDYHGPGFRAGRELGTVPVPHEVVERLVDAGVRI